jgi:site-specific recombinase XerD
MMARLDALEGRDRVVFALARLAGLRHGEVCALDADAVLLDARAIEVRSAPIAGLKGPEELCRTPAGPDLRPTGQHPARERSSGRWRPVLPARTTWGRVNVVHAHERMRVAWEDAGLEPLGRHEARHSFASILIVAGYDVASVSEWIGHSQPSTTLDRYVKPLRKRGVDREAAEEVLGPFP